MVGAALLRVAAVTAAKAPVIPCAIYTRKSSEEGLDQDFNSLDAQREACAAYILSQKAQGWKSVGAPYDDGGFSGGNTERPGLQRLLADIAAKKIRIVVVYKVDRLTRSLADFAKLVELFDAHGASFVSVTQQFNTTSSMGRLTLNVLLSFAQFEREVTGERIRDKIAASKRKGMWMGGVAPIGYLPSERSLVIDQPRAEQVRAIYRLYLDLGCVRKLKAELDRRGWRTQPRKTRRADAAGGCSFSRGHLYRILANPVYLGRIAHKDQVYEGQHPAIIDEALWSAVQERLARNAAQSRGDGSTPSHASLLIGRVFDAANRRLSSSHARKGTQRYRYYVRPAVAESEGIAAEPALRIPAPELETAVVQTITRVLNDRSGLVDLIGPVSATETKARLQRAAALTRQLDMGAAEERATVVRALVPRVTVRADGLGVKINVGAIWGAAEPIVQHDVPVRLRRCGMAMRLVVEGPGGANRAATRTPDLTLVALLSRAHEWFGDLTSGRADSVHAIATAAGLRSDRAARIIHLAFLAPDVTERILRGDHPPELTATRLLDHTPLPTDWAAQRNLLGFSG